MNHPIKPTTPIALKIAGKSFSSRDSLAISNNQNEQYTINGTIYSQIEKEREELSISDIDRKSISQKKLALQNISYMHADPIKRYIREYLKLNIASIKPEQLLINIANDHLKYNIQADIALLKEAAKYDESTISIVLPAFIQTNRIIQNELKNLPLYN
ncbi:hypothetical protein ACTFIZ_004219 [Dictyostelium cf. discoideum]